MRKIYFLLVLVLASARLFGQKSNLDSLKRAYQKNKQDTTLAELYFIKSATVFLTTNVDSGMIYARKTFALSSKIHYKKGEVQGLALIANYQNINGDLPGALKTTFEALPEALKIREMRTVGSCYNTRGLTYSTMDEHQKALDNYYAGLLVVENNHFDDLAVTMLNNIARAYLDMNRLDSATYFSKRAYNFAIKKNMRKNLGYLIRNFGIIEFKNGHPEKAINYFRKSLADSSAKGNHYLQSEDYRRIAEAWQRLNKSDSCIYYAKKAAEQAKLDRNPDQVQRATTLLTAEYKARSDFKNAFYYQEVTQKARDSLFSQQKTLQVQNLVYNEQQRRQAAEAAAIAYQNKVRYYTLLGVLGVVVLVAIILLYANSQRKKANGVLQQRNEQIESQHKALEKTLSELKHTQNQLIQAEKMASLGELTAGIAHEIQNPLNFVNNFSEVNAELIDEMQQEIGNGNYDEVNALARDIKENEQKINMHGKRADSIVKGMLQHSRTSTGEKQLTNINALADEFFKLSYHGLRAKDKNFNAVPIAIGMITRFDEQLPKVNVSQQDIGRVMLSLFNNAFYAVAEKKKLAGEGFHPAVAVATNKTGDKIVITVRDNGNGISPKILDKIYQPFFTTKPTGEGTGLGLSLSYDIVKAHGGEINVETKDGEFTEFAVYLPINQ